MSAATKALPLLIALAVAGCGGNPEQNVVITNDIPADAEVEVLPADESVATPTDDLANGAAEPQVNETAANGS